MDRSRFIAGLIGPTLAAVAVSLFINGDLALRLAEQMTGGYALLFVSGIITLVAGLAIVMTHNIWRGWPAIVTAFGWLAVIGGLTRILAPRQLAEWAPGLVAQGPPVMVVAGLVLLLGLFLSWKAFRA